MDLKILKKSRPKWSYEIRSYPKQIHWFYEILIFMENIIKRKNSLNGTIYIFFCLDVLRFFGSLRNFKSGSLQMVLFQKKFSSNFEKLKLIRYPQKSQSWDLKKNLNSNLFSSSSIYLLPILYLSTYSEYIPIWYKIILCK